MAEKKTVVLPNVFSIYSDPQITTVPSDYSITLESFFILLNYITSADEGVLRIEEIADQEEVIRLISEFGKYQLSLLCHHTISLNPTVFSWELKKQLSEQLKTHFTPPWLMNIMPMDRGFKDLFLSELKYDFSEESRRIIRQIIDLLKDNYFVKFKEDLLVGLEFSTWSFETITYIIDILNEMRLGLDQTQFNEIFGHLQQELGPMLFDQVMAYEGQLSKYIALNFILLYYSLNQGEEGLISAQDQIDDLWKSIQDDQTVVETQRYIFLAFYSLIIKRLFDDTNQFVIKRNLVQSIYAKFDNDIFKNSHLINTILNTQEVHPWVMDKFILGLQAYNTLMFNYLTMLPSCKERDRYRIHLEKVSDVMYRLVIDYLVRNYSLTHPRDDVDRFLTGCHQLGLPLQYLNSIFQHIITSNRILLFLKKARMYQEAYQYRLDLWLKTLQQLNEKELVFLHEIDILLITGQYPFFPILQMITSELQPDQSIMSSKTFEKRIIKVISQSLEFLAKGYEEEAVFNEEAYLILLSFSAEWLQYFSQDNRLFNDANGVLSAIIIICFSHLSRSYFSNKNIEKAFLMYLNLYFFSEYLNQRVYTMNLSGDDYRSVADSIPQKFLEMTEEWNFKNLIDLDFIGKSAKGLELSIRSTLDSVEQTVHSTMLDDDLLFEFLDMTDALTDFLTVEMGHLTPEKLMKLDEFDVHQLPDSDALSRIARIGNSLDNPLPFPFIRQVDQLSVAMTLMPFDYGSDTINDRMLVDSIISLLNLKGD